MTHLFPNFLIDAAEYTDAERHWENIWNSISAIDRADWRPNWFSSNGFKDGNPIFSAVSEKQRKGIRIIQYEPQSNDLEFDFWLDTFGGGRTDPSAIFELVITCALSEESSERAGKLMSSWIAGDIEFANYSGAPHGVVDTRPSLIP